MQIWCDASFGNNTKKAGLAITLIRMLSPKGINRNYFEIPAYAADNNEAELLAIKFGVEQAIQYKPERINIITDSVVAINAIKNPEQASSKYKKLAFCIRELIGDNFHIYHRKAHTKNIKGIAIYSCQIYSDFWIFYCICHVFIPFI